MRQIVTIVAIVAATLGITVGLHLSLRARPCDVDDLLAAYHSDAGCRDIVVEYPSDGTLFPPDMAAPTFRWRDDAAQSDAWLVRLEFAGDKPSMSALVRKQQWTPSPQDWESIKQNSVDHEAKVVVFGVRWTRPARVFSRAGIGIRTSTDEVGAPLFYREVNLPFIDAVKDPSHIRWRFGAISSPEPPPVVLENLPVCGNCHSFTQDGENLAMDVDYANSKGSYVITRVQREMTLATSNIITWNDYRKEDGEQTFGLLSQISPDGRYVVSTVKDKSVFVPQPRLAFSQLFFPIRGILCIYDRETGQFSALPGADDPAFVQSNPTWSPDGKYIVFARSEAYDLQGTRGKGKVLLTREECKEFTKDGKPFLFDLYRVAFNKGQGGTPEPVEGASHNNMSNYFGRYSPDGRWIVFCKARSYMLLQPDSELYIIPAEGGRARRLQCNTGRMNSWHSWSPNGRWLVFASKAYSDYTQLFLTHIDGDGYSTPPVLLDRLSAPDRAANIPEFVNAPPAAISRIHEQFLNDYSFVRAGNEFFRHGEPDRAIEEYENALALNPNNADAHRRLGFLYYHVKDRFDQGMAHLLRAHELTPEDPRIHYDLGTAFLHQGRCDEAIGHLAEALKRIPDGLDEQYSPARMHFHMGRALLAAGRCEQAKEHLSEALRLAPNQPKAHYQLALALAGLDRVEQAIPHYDKAIDLLPSVDTSPVLHHLIATHHLKNHELHKALQHEERALELARRTGDSELVRKLEDSVAYCRNLLKTGGD